MERGDLEIKTGRQNALKHKEKGRALKQKLKPNVKTVLVMGVISEPVSTDKSPNLTERERERESN